MIYVDEKPQWNENTILTMSLSKIGLPAMRTGIVVANEEVTEIMGRINALTQLAVGAAGAALVAPLLENRELLRVCRELIMPFYRRRVRDAVGFCHDALNSCDYHVHKPEGSMFLWLWFPGAQRQSNPVPAAEGARRHGLVRRPVLPGAEHPLDPRTRVAYGSMCAVIRKRSTRA